MIKLNSVDGMRCIDLFAALDAFAISYFDLFKKGEVVEIEDEDEFRSKLRALWQTKNNDAFIEKYIASKNVKSEDASLLRSWKNRVKATYIILKYTRDYVVFYCMDDNTYYAVLCLTQSLKNMVPQKPPYMAQTTLLPYKNSIIYDGLIAPYRVVFGKNMCASIKEEFQQAIVKTTLI